MAVVFYQALVLLKLLVKLAAQDWKRKFTQKLANMLA